MGVAEADGARGLGRGGRVKDGNVDEEGVTAHLGFVRGSKDARRRQSVVEQGDGAAVLRGPLGIVDLAEKEARADPCGLFQDHQVARHQLLQHDEDGHLRRDRLDQGFEVAECAGHADRTPHGPGVDVPADDTDGGGT